jgi:ABC-type nitrate/sulfonate/bicarbonate transport system substrate-binding protein
LALSLTISWTAAHCEAPGDTPADSRADTQTVRAFVPDPNNLQWMNFWVARGGGFFAREGLDVQLVVPPKAGKGAQFLKQGKADVGVMPRPMYLTLIGEGQPVVVFANLLANDPINLVLRDSVARQRNLSADMPLKERLEGLHGLKVGVAPGPPPRLRKLFESVGLNADRDIEMVIFPGPAQNAAFGDLKVDALYAHTPYVERALVEQGAVMLVNQSAGEVAALSGRQIHAMVTTRKYAQEHPDVLVRISRAIYHAQQLIHADRKAAREAILVSGVELEFPAGLETIVGLYEPAVPGTPAVSIEDALGELDLYPAKKAAPNLTRDDLKGHVDNQFVEAALAGAH